MCRDVSYVMLIAVTYFRYRIWKNGVMVEEVSDVSYIQKSENDMVGFLLGCSFSFEVITMCNWTLYLIN